MSLVEVRSSWLSVAPKVWIEGDGEVLCARTSKVWQALSLGAYAREVRFDRRKREISIRTKLAYFVQRETVIPYARLARIEYRFGSLGTGLIGGYRAPRSFTGHVHRTGHSSDQIEWFTIELVLQNPFERVEALFFTGEGAKLTGVYGVLMGDSVVDFAGEQEQESLEVFDLIERFTGVGPSGRIAGAKLGGAGRECSVCQHPCGPDAVRCVYCGVLIAKPDAAT